MTKSTKISLVILILVLVSIGGYFGLSELAKRNQAEPEPVQETEEQQFEERPIQVLFLAGDKNYEATVKEDTSVLELMETLRELGALEFSGRESEYGFFVEEINGVANDESANMYWSLYVNDELAQVGAADLIIQNDDVIAWKYEEVKL